MKKFLFLLLNFAVFGGDLPEIVSQPKPEVFKEGAVFSLEIKATGKPPLFYQWYKDGKLLDIKTRPHLAIAMPTKEDSGTYHCRVSNKEGSVDSNAVKVIVSE